MSDSESFLARWSRRKQGTATARREEAKAAEDAERTAPPAEDADLPAEAAAVEPASLPPVESIGPGSDVRAFLQAGVPADLTRAALRRAWSADPDIRDFVGLAENAWDFNAPDGAAGFGPVTADEVRRLLEHMTDSPAGTGPGQTAEAATEPAAAAPSTDNDGAVPVADQDQPRNAQESAAQETIIAQGNKENDAAQQNPGNSEYEPVLARRGHGGAIPQ